VRIEIGREQNPDSGLEEKRGRVEDE